MKETGIIKSKIDQIMDILVLGAVIAMVLSYLFYSLGLSHVGIIIADFLGIQADLLYMPIDIVGMLLLLVFHKWWNRDKYKGSFRKFTVDWKFVIILIVYMAGDLALILAELISGKGHVPNLQYTLLAIFAGVCEEVAFRVMPISITLRRKGDNTSIIIAIICTAIGFGLAHSVAAIMSGEGDIIGTIFKVFLTGASGTVFAAIYLRTGNILPSMIIHALHDYLSFAIVSEESNVYVVSGGVEAGAVVYYLIMITFYITITVLLLRKHMDEVKEVWYDRWSR